MRVIARCKLRLCFAALLAALLSACLVPPRPAPPPPQVPGAETPAPHEGVPYDIVPQESLLTIRVYRGGTLAGAGHNHVIAAHAIEGTIYVPADVMRASFEARILVAGLTVDEAALRAEAGSAEFPPEVPQTAKDGTRRNMLSAALLDAERNPQIVLRAVRIEAAGSPAGAAGGAGSPVLARVQTTVAGQVRSITVPVRYELTARTLVASGDAPLRQTDLGLTPFSALLGALQVQDEMRVRFRIVARTAAARGATPR
jgi:hypothetical protein